MTPELRDSLEHGRRLCVEVPAETEDCRGWFSIEARLERDAIREFYVWHFEYRNRWVATEHDPCSDELPVEAHHRFATEAELESFLDRALPEEAQLERVQDSADFPM